MNKRVAIISSILTVILCVIVHFNSKGYKSTYEPINTLETTKNTLETTINETTDPPTTTLQEETSIEEVTTVVKYSITLYDVPLSDDEQIEVNLICNKYNIDYRLVLGVISVECKSYNPKAIGDNGRSFGLMQIQPKWWSELMVEIGTVDLLDPVENIHTGVAILRTLIDRYGTERGALQAYNTGKPYTTNGYADRVYKGMSELKVKKIVEIGG